jgi:hypothetical protein
MVGLGCLLSTGLRDRSTPTDLPASFSRLISLAEPDTESLVGVPSRVTNRAMPMSQTSTSWSLVISWGGRPYSGAALMFQLIGVTDVRKVLPYAPSQRTISRWTISRSLSGMSLGDEI